MALAVLRLPDRVAFLMREPNVQEMVAEMKSIIDERNAVFHSGVPEKESPEVLAYRMHIISRNVINSILQQYPLSFSLPKHYGGNQFTKEDLIKWIDSNKHITSESKG